MTTRSSRSPDTVSVGTPRAEHHDQSVGIGEREPRLSWQLDDHPPGWRQEAYEIEIVAPDTGTTIRTGQIVSADSLLVPWPAAPLHSRARRTVRVRVWGTGAAPATPSAWSPPLALETGLLRPDDWSASFIAADESFDEGTPLLRHEFVVSAPVASARLYASALGLYELELNGDRVGDQAFTPGWTSYHSRLRYQTFDVTTALRPGRNAIGGWLADGWYRGRLGFGGGVRNIYGDTVALLAQLEITHADGTTSRVGTGPWWRCARGPIRSSDIYDGEHHDARLELPGWSRAGFDDSGWRPVRVVPRDLATLVAPTGPAVRRTGAMTPVSIRPAPSGSTIVDFGQNLVGRLRIVVTGPQGSTVRLRHAEVLQDGELCLRPLRTASATDEYVLREGGEQSWEPRFTFHGFRYAEVTGEARLISATALVYHTDMRRTGEFHCSDPQLEQLHRNVVWSMRGNFLDVPTDCPQRDERLGWTGDLQVFATTAAYLYDCAGMLRSWLRDLAAEQLADGTVPLIVPVIPTGKWDSLRAVAVWGDAAVLVPWALYWQYGDVQILRDQYASAKAWVDAVTGRAGDDHVWDTGDQLGDWLDPAAPADDPAAAKADPHLVATAYYARSTGVLAQMARLVDRPDDAEHYAVLAERIAAGFARRWVQPSGLLSNDCQTGYALALRFGLVPEGRPRERAARRLVELVRAAGHRIGTGFAGTPNICDALAENGQLDTAYALLTQRTCPSWLYPVAQGATTVWERWDSILPDGTIHPGRMLSFNHYALGAVADWLHRTVAGLAPAEPGYRRILVRPRPGGGLTHAATACHTPFGRAAVAWRSDGDSLVVDVEVPPGTTALVELPGRPRRSVGPGAHRFQAGPGDNHDGTDDDSAGVGSAEPTAQRAP
ncbi:family 78 glycoside hydrolase catalytic domain [Micromonospora sp. LOL_023]|uniref:family 78 glycoside hydrolase catalytic domain n=1 Tax=Micromonospora sp. LOL_023 TaxID=3345418 RepID=UPI003A8BF699